MTLDQLRQRQAELYEQLQKNGYNATLVNELGILSFKVSNALKQRKKNAKDYTGLRINYRYLDN